MSMPKLKIYRVWYSNRSRAAVKARSAREARKKAWDMTDYKFGWTKSDFMRSATVERV